ncbi:ABC transporter permease [Thermicanus aegyptius]|uniref:ABC transporter permease n=1 Tax=Thermicanus aegyptius TaxID=94009 RepID=UPI00040233C3|nr:ABC transporter permease [Thermicanus aegyptius]
MVWKIYLKELKDAFRDRKTLFLSVFVPVMMIAATSFLYEYLFFDSAEKVENITVGISDKTDQAALEWLSTLEYVKFVRTEDPQRVAEAGDVQIAMVVDDAFVQKLEQGLPTKITLYADQTSMKVSRAVDLLLGELNQKKDEIVTSRLVKAGIDPKQVTPFAAEVKSFSEKSETSLLLLSMLFSLIIVMSVMLGGFPSAVDLFAGEKERKTMESLLITPVSRMKLIAAKWLTVATIGTLSGLFAIAAFVLIAKTAAPKLGEGLMFGEQTLLLLTSAIVGILLFAFLFAVVQMIISMMSHTFKEAQNYISPVMFLALVPYYLLIGVAPNELQSYHFLIPFMNTFALLKELIYGIFSLSHMLFVAASSILFILIGFLFAYVMFRKDKWVLGR